LGQFAIAAITARLFLPADFGGFAAALSLMGLMTLLTTTGLPSFILREHDLSRSQVHSVRLVAAVAGVLTGVAYFLAVPWWLMLLKAQEGQQFIWILALAQVLGPIASVESALLRREIRPIGDSISVLSAFIGSSGVGLALALWTRQAWTLGIPVAGNPLILAGAAYLLQRQRHQVGRLLDWGAMFTFSRKITLQNVGFLILQQVPSWLVSGALGAAALGQFSKGASLAVMPASVMTQLQGRVAHPHWRRFKSRISFEEAVRDSVLISAGLAFPAFAILAANGSAVINLWLGPGWETAGSLVGSMAIGYALSIPFTLMAGSFEMRGRFAATRAAQWCMFGALLPPLGAMILFHDPWWAGIAISLSQAAALASLIAVAPWSLPTSRRTLVTGIVRQAVWSVLIGFSGLVAGVVATAVVQNAPSRDLLQVLVAAPVSVLCWGLTFRWHPTSQTLGKRGLVLPWILRTANT
jgi:PST family polysaccharide transporter